MDIDPKEIVFGVAVTIISLGVFGWAIFRWQKRSDDSTTWLVVKWLVTSLIVPVVVFAVPVCGPVGIFLDLLCAVVLVILWSGNLCSLVAKPFMDLIDGGDAPPDPIPYYSVAQSRRKQGRYVEAIDEVRKQLKKFPNDFEGHLLLAKIQAENLNDVPGAELTLQRFCQRPGRSPRQIGAALNQMADWQMQLGQDRDAALRHLEKISQLFPNSDMAFHAAERIAHLANTETLLAPFDRHEIVLPEGVQYPALVGGAMEVKAPDSDPEKLAAEYVKRLEQHPLDSEARERLAMLYAEHYRRPDLAVRELEQLIAVPNQPSTRVIRWLTILADIQVGHASDLAAARHTLERIIELFPDSPAAENALRRLDHIKLGLKRSATNEPVKLGNYEQNMGLRKRE